MFLGLDFSLPAPFSLLFFLFLSLDICHIFYSLLHTCVVIISPIILSTVNSNRDLRYQSYCKCNLVVRVSLIAHLPIKEEASLLCGLPKMRFHPAPPFCCCCCFTSRLWLARNFSNIWIFVIDIYYRMYTQHRTQSKTLVVTVLEASCF